MGFWPEPPALSPPTQVMPSLRPSSPLLRGRIRRLSRQRPVWHPGPAFGDFPPAGLLASDVSHLLGDRSASPFRAVVVDPRLQDAIGDQVVELRVRALDDQRRQRHRPVRPGRRAAPDHPPGPMLLQAQKNDIRLEAEQSVEVSASQQHVLVTAKEHITLMCGGAYLTLKGGNIELGMPGNFVVKAAKHSHVGPAHASTSFNAWDSTPFDDRYVLRDEATLEPLPNIAVEVIRGDGGVVKLMTDSQGRLPKQQHLAMDPVQIRILGQGQSQQRHGVQHMSSEPLEPNQDVIIPRSRDSLGRPVYKAQLTRTDNQSEKVALVRQTAPLPVIFIPGIMGTNLRNKADKSEVWRPPNGLWPLGDFAASFGALWTWAWRGPKVRQKLLRAERVEVDDQGTIDVGQSGLDEDAARLRGWGKVMRSAYNPVMGLMERRLDNIVSRRELQAWWNDEALSPPADQGEEQGKVGPIDEEELLKASRYQFDVWCAGYNWLQSNRQSALDVRDYIENTVWPFYQKEYWSRVPSK